MSKKISRTQEIAEQIQGIGGLLRIICAFIICGALIWVPDHYHHPMTQTGWEWVTGICIAGIIFWPRRRR